MDHMDKLPVKPPASGYTFFFSKIYKDMASLAHKEKVVEISRRWKALSEEERGNYNREVQQRKQQYREAMDKILDSLSPADKERLEQEVKAKRKRRHVMLGVQPSMLARRCPSQHSTDRPHICPVCFKSFRHKTELSQHDLVHSNERKFKCDFCEKAFKQLSHVQQHMRLHTGVRPYKCKYEECDKAFLQLSNLQYHHHNHHKETTPTIHVPPEAETQHHNHHKDAMPTIHVPPDAETQHHNHHKDAMPTIHVPPEAETQHHNQHKDVTPTIHVPPDAETHHYNHHKDATPTIHVPPEAETQGQGHHQHIPKAEMHG